MRALAIAVSFFAAVLLVPAAAQATHPVVCDWDDVPCIVDCLLFHDPCGITNPPDPFPLTGRCGGDEVGTVVFVLGEPVDACFDVDLGACPPPFVGVVVYLDGQPHGVCVA
ncbi:MAG TPA: hypothetical protein VHH36_08825 [Candidatus Thermoplasmatota archaeon]|nr:hypothetical protein [Candidatus Thermoplasmatota archaeon]